MLKNTFIAFYLFWEGLHVKFRARIHTFVFDLNVFYQNSEILQFLRLLNILSLYFASSLFLLYLAYVLIFRRRYFCNLLKDFYYKEVSTARVSLFFLLLLVTSPFYIYCLILWFVLAFFQLIYLGSLYLKNLILSKIYKEVKYDLWLTFITPKMLKTHIFFEDKALPSCASFRLLTMTLNYYVLGVIKFSLAYIIASFISRFRANFKEDTKTLSRLQKLVHKFKRIYLVTASYGLGVLIIFTCLYPLWWFIYFWILSLSILRTIKPAIAGKNKSSYPIIFVLFFFERMTSVFVSFQNTKIRFLLQEGFLEEN